MSAPSVFPGFDPQKHVCTHEKDQYGQHTTFKCPECGVETRTDHREIPIENLVLNYVMIYCDCGVKACIISERRIGAESPVEDLS